MRLARAASRLSLESPFVVIGLGGGKLVLRRRDVPLATSAYSIAVRTTLNWGVATIAGVTSQLATVAGAGASPGFVARVLATARGFEWLDQDNGWFWFRNRPSRMLDGLQKIFSVVTELSLRRLYWALFKGHDERLRPAAPWRCRSLASALPGARVENDRSSGYRTGSTARPICRRTSERWSSSSKDAAGRAVAARAARRRGRSARSRRGRSSRSCAARRSSRCCPTDAAA